MPAVTLPALAAHTAAALLIVSVLVAAWFWLRRRFGLMRYDIGMDATVFVVFTLVLERTLHLYLLQLNPTTVHWLCMPTLSTIYGVLMAGVSEQSGCWISPHFLVRKPGDAATSVAYAFGHVGIEARLVGAASQAQMVIFGLATNHGELELCLAASDAFVTAGTIHAMLAQLSPWPALDVASERVTAMLIQFTFTLVVWHAVQQRRFVIAVLTVLPHALADLLATLYQVCVLPLAVTEAVYAVTAALLATTCWPPQGGRKVGESSLR